MWTVPWTQEEQLWSVIFTKTKQIEDSFEDLATVRALTQEILVGIRDLVEKTTGEDVWEAIKLSYGLKNVAS